ncbi:Uncharacterised protein [Candidatus Tiddalikarchaeum anstoanum]|nr:Uncharacterised protein [Candidatus Tiddalikarchaeum anstoanum]
MSSCSCTGLNYTTNPSYNSSLSAYDIISFDSSNNTLSKYEAIKNDCSKYLNDYNSTIEQAKFIHSYVQNNIYHNYSTNQSSLEKLIDSGEGNCLSVTSLYYLLVKDLVKNADIKIVTPKGHIAAMVEGKFVENTIKNGFDIYFNKSFTVHENGEGAILAALYNNKAANQTDKHDALRLYEHSLKYNTNMIDVYSNLAQIYSNIGSESLARECLNNISRLNNSKVILQRMPSFESFNILKLNNNPIKPKLGEPSETHTKKVGGIELVLITNSEPLNITFKEEKPIDYYITGYFDNKYKYFRKGNEYSF